MSKLVQLAFAGCLASVLVAGCTTLPHAGSHKTQRGILTGSLLEQPYERADTITSAAMPVTILDHERLRQLGVRSLTDLAVFSSPRR